MWGGLFSVQGSCWKKKSIVLAAWDFRTPSENTRECSLEPCPYFSLASCFSGVFMGFVCGKLHSIALTSNQYQILELYCCTSPCRDSNRIRTHWPAGGWYQHLQFENVQLGNEREGIRNLPPILYTRIMGDRANQYTLWGNTKNVLSLTGKIATVGIMFSSKNC